MIQKRPKFAFEQGIGDADPHFAKGLATAQHRKADVIFLDRAINHFDLFPDSAFINGNKILTALDDLAGKFFSGMEQGAAPAVHNGCVKDDWRPGLDGLQ